MRCYPPEVSNSAILRKDICPLVSTADPADDQLLTSGALAHIVISMADVLSSLEIARVNSEAACRFIVAMEGSRAQLSMAHFS
jgi:hypothetical protein